MPNGLNVARKTSLAGGCARRHAADSSKGVAERLDKVEVVDPIHSWSKLWAQASLYSKLRKKSDRIGIADNAAVLFDNRA